MEPNISINVVLCLFLGVGGEGVWGPIKGQWGRRNTIAATRIPEYELALASALLFWSNLDKHIDIFLKASQLCFYSTLGRRQECSGYSEGWSCMEPVGMRMIQQGKLMLLQYSSWPHLKHGSLVLGSCMTCTCTGRGASMHVYFVRSVEWSSSILSYLETEPNKVIKNELTCTSCFVVDSCMCTILLDWLRWIIVLNQSN